MLRADWHAAASVQTETRQWPGPDAVSREMQAGREWKHHVMLHCSAADNNYSVLWLPSWNKYLLTYALRYFTRWVYFCTDKPGFHIMPLHVPLWRSAGCWVGCLEQPTVYSLSLQTAISSVELQLFMMREFLTVLFGRIRIHYSAYYSVRI